MANFPPSSDRVRPFACACVYPFACQLHVKIWFLLCSHTYLNVLLVAFSSDNGSAMNLLVNIIELSQRMPAHPRFVYVLYLKVYLQPVEPFSFLQNLFSISFRAVLGGGLTISCLSFFYFLLKLGIIWFGIAGVCGSWETMKVLKSISVRIFPPF